MGKRRSPAAAGEQVNRPGQVVSLMLTEAVGNSLAVPYIPNLTIMFACHLHVNLCISRERGIKYLFKYMSKGRHGVTVQLVADFGNH